MPASPRFIDDTEIQQALDAATSAALAQLQQAFPELDPRAPELHEKLRAQLARWLLDHSPNGQHPLILGEDAFGDRFDIHSLPLARPGSGYAVQWLDTDTILDQRSGRFCPVRQHGVQGLFPSFDAAHAAARVYLETAGLATAHALAIVPAYFDAELERHVLIYGVLTQSP